MIRYSILALTAMVCLSLACNKASVVGGSLTGGDVLDLVALDMVDVRIQTVEQDSIAVRGSEQEFCPAIFDNIRTVNESDRTRLVLTNYEDPIFGNLDSEIYIQWVRNYFNLPPRDSLQDFVIDSAYMRLPYNGNLVYGDTSQTFDLEVYEITDFMIDPESTIYLEQGFETNLTPLITQSGIVPRPRTSITEMRINTSGDLDTVDFVPHVKIDLDPMWAQNLISTLVQDSATLVGDTTFLERFPGLMLRSSGLTDAILGFNGDITQSAGENQISIQLHYSNMNSGTRGIISLIPGISSLVNPIQGRKESVLHNRIVHDYVSTEMATALNNPEYADTTILIGRHAGAAAEFVIKNADIPVDAIINLAQIQLTSKDFTRDPLNGPADRIIFYNADSDEDGVRDYPFEALNATTNGFTCRLNSTLFGGDRRTISNENGDLVNQFTVSITDEMQDLIENRLDSIHIIMTSFPDIDEPGVLRLGGPASETNPLSLKVVYTSAP